MQIVHVVTLEKYSVRQNDETVTAPEMLHTRGGGALLHFSPRICIDLTGVVTAAGGDQDPGLPWLAPRLRGAAVTKGVTS